ncbi:uncharacterized protein C20orf96 homolog [Tenrec ecaudatus]|uniref:uncharacterized protein C20orf96 homolog n=1 Tax=Tenrec ecaudatus TaxID=94439 RepID=UPI003F59C6EC
MEDYGPWQRSKKKTKTSILLPVQPTSSHKKNKTKPLISVQPALPSPSSFLVAKQPRTQRKPSRGEKVDSGGVQARIRLMRAVLKSRQISLRELQDHEKFLIKRNQDLVKTIQNMEDSSALQSREMLQQQDILSNVIDIVEYSNKKRLEEFEGELQKFEQEEEEKMNYLEQQVDQLNAKIKKTQEEVNFLSTYMDHEYPLKSVQISTLLRQLQQMKDLQQDEVDDLQEMRKKVLESLFNKIQEKKRDLLRSLAERALRPHQEILVQNTRDNQDILRYIDKFRDFNQEFLEEIPALRAQVRHLQTQIRQPREIIFADVLLRRPKCPPDMDVVLNIPREELLPF